MIINAIKQDPLNPIVFLTQEDLALMSGVLMIDVSCDHGMGFSFARPTTFAEPVIHYGSNDYYAVENIPALAWEMVTSSLTENMVKIVKHFIAGRPKNKLEEVLLKATEISDGLVVNQDIIAYRAKLDAEAV